jgi:geranylgeranyl pyrophosphate synthase
VADACAQVALGQELDTHTVVDEAAYWRVVAAKSAAFFGLAFTLGALSAGADPATTGTLARLGGLYGEMVQIHDDLRDTLSTPASPDWLQARAPLPILYATLVPHPERTAFREWHNRVLGQGAEAVPALEAAQAILRRSGAISYGLDQILRRDRQARAWLADLTLYAPEDLGALLDEIVAPVRALITPTSSLPEPAGSDSLA